MEDKKEIKEKVLEWHRLVNIGLVKGLSFTPRDERLEDINFWRRRSNLFDAFAHCIQSLVTEQDYSIDEKNLREISEEGYKNTE